MQVSPIFDSVWKTMRRCLNGPAGFALAAALLGWLFDGAEMGLFSLVGRPAILNLLIDGGMAKEAAEAQACSYVGLPASAELCRAG